MCYEGLCSTSKTFCWLGSNMNWKVSFHVGLMSLSMCLVLFLLSGADGMHNATYGSGVSTACTNTYYFTAKPKVQIYTCAVEVLLYFFFQ